MKYLKLFENFSKEMEMEIIDIHDLKRRINIDNEDIDMDNILIRLPNGKIITWDEYIENDWNQKYDISSDHTISPMLKKKKLVPDGIGSKSKKKRKGYWENM